MRVIIGLGHPAHFHLFINVIRHFNNSNIPYKVVINDKDILKDLLISADVEFYVLANENTSIKKISKLKKLLYSTKKLKKIVELFKPTLLIGCIPQIGHLGFIRNIPSLFFAEDDFKATYIQGLILYPFITNMITPVVTKTQIFPKKKIGYSGYHELAYLNKGIFNPDISKIQNKINTSVPFFILRFANLTAHHDSGKTGISTSLGTKIIETLKLHGNIYITSERELEPEFEKYRIEIAPFDIHHAMYYATMYIGDSQTMAAEAAVLGTPSLRFNDFVGKLGYLEELEHTYGLTYGIKTSEPEKLLAKVEELLNMPNLKEEWQKRRKKMLAEKIDVTAFMVWFIENYPKSVEKLQSYDSYRTHGLTPELASQLF